MSIRTFQQNLAMRIFSTAFFTILLAGTLAAQPRIWKSTDGRELIGEFVKSDSESVTVRRNNGKISVIPLALLDSADQRFAATQQASVDAAQQAKLDAGNSSKKPQGAITYQLSGGSEKWPEERKKAITDAMDAAVTFYNEHANFKKQLTANNSPGTPTADANYSGWINWGGSISRRVALHEISHTLGIGTHENWGKNIKDGVWIGKHARALIREFDGKDAVLRADRMHFWPYGLNFDNESDKKSDLRHVKMVEAMRKDMGIR